MIVLRQPRLISREPSDTSSNFFGFPVQLSGKGLELLNLVVANCNIAYYIDFEYASGCLESASSLPDGIRRTRSNIKLFRELKTGI